MAAKQPEQVLVLGATGHIGQAVTRHWLDRGCKVTAATRQADPEALRGLAVRIARVDEELTALPELARGHDLMVDAAAPHPLDPRDRGSLNAALCRTSRVLDAVRGSGARLVFVSSFTTLPAAAWRNPVYPYFAVKTAMEQQVLAAAQRGLPAAIVNPAACLGPWEFRAQGSSFTRLVLARKLPVVMRQVLNVIDVRDVAVGINLALAHECFARPIPLAGHNIAVADLAAQLIALDCGAPAPPLTIDSRIASAMALAVESAYALSGRQAPDLWRAVPLIAAGFPMQPSLEQSVIGLSIRPLEVTLRDAVRFHRRRREGGSPP